MSGSAAAEGVVEPIVIVHGPSLTSYSFSDEHPLQPSRHELTMSLLAMLGWLDGLEVSVENPRPATFSELLAAHTLPYIQAVQTAQSIARGERPPADLRIYGLGSEDNPLFPYMHEAPALLAGASVQAMQAVLESRALHAYNPAGGMHHAMRARAAGFCIYNDIVVAIAVALDQGRRVAYVDLDAHHGDGVQAAFYDDPRVLTVSLHESGEFLFPGTGYATETGAGEGRGPASMSLSRRSAVTSPYSWPTTGSWNRPWQPTHLTSWSPRRDVTPITPTRSPTWPAPCACTPP